jgi:diaminopimelate dehydrogenase
MKQIRVCVVGYGNVGREAVECVRQAPDMELAAVVEVLDVDCPYAPVVRNVDSLENVDVAVLAVPSRVVPKVAPEYLAKGINTVDGYDIHGDSTLSLRRQLDECAEQSGATAIIGAGWDPGTDSIIRMLFSAIAPHGITYTNFGPGMSMGHSCAVRDIPGVKDGVSFTLPVGYGQHNRDVYVELDDPARFDEIARAIKEDPYFVHDNTRVTMVEDVDQLKVMGHGVLIERMGASGPAHNQRLELKMALSNPSATAQVMVCAARASMRLKPGCYVLAEIPPIDLLPGDRESLIRSFV